MLLDTKLLFKYSNILICIVFRMSCHHCTVLSPIKLNKLVFQLKSKSSIIDCMHFSDFDHKTH